ncbi:sigma-70 family RNA polymerase sigma factor [Aquihabitans sp. G128]|uniref:sigma-70 family RNA polymerase sigma factor n=1 Tax=Aquihabitans sp. G128 TaxID=2849779 RepID=UPI001C23250B|nr:sigma-70 family RNA polymerase sigma factor [Aquihabitans sp. G128]QXC61522.1 sigma-70 family RNA polymerase sigma factor [Aquihabitans sp. G128]
MTGESSELLDLFRRYRETGDRRVRNDIVERHRHLADRYARRYRARGIPVEDLRQTALLAMVRAVDRFDPDQGVTFATFASRTMDGELKRALRDKAWAVRPPRAAQERHLALRKREEELTHSLGRAPTVTELAKALDVTIDEVLEAIEAGGARTAGGITRTNDDGAVVEADDLLSVGETGYGRVDDRMLVAELLEQLGEREREVIRLRFFERLGQEEIAQRVGVSQSYLSRLLRRILLDLREKVGELPEGFLDPTLSDD